MKDQISIDRLNKLHPLIRDAAMIAYDNAVRRTPVGVHPFITQTMRSFAESNKLYAQGRTTPGNIVTNAKAGQSFHNYGLAIDFVNMVNNVPHWVVDNNWRIVVNAFKEQGFTWGGDFKSIKDYPHFEKTMGYTWRQLLAKYEAGKVDAENYVLL